MNFVPEIESLIGHHLYLRDVPYSMEDGAKEVDPDSIVDAAKDIQKLINAKILILLENFTGPSYEVDNQVHSAILEYRELVRLDNEK